MTQPPGKPSPPIPDEIMARAIEFVGRRKKLVSFRDKLQQVLTRALAAGLDRRQLIDALDGAAARLRGGG